MVGHKSATSRLDFVGNPDMDPDSGIFLKKLTLAVLAIIKPLHCAWFRQQSENAQVGEYQIEQIRCRLGVGLGSPSASVLVQ